MELAYCVPKGIPYSKFKLWDPDDRAAALEYEEQMRTVCQRCGTRPAEWKKSNVAYIGEQYRCTGCEVLAQEQRNVPQAMEDYMHVFLVPNPEVTDGVP